MSSDRNNCSGEARTTNPTGQKPIPFFNSADFAKTIAVEAEEFAKLISQEGNNCNKNSQIRKFYEELVRLQQQAVEMPESDFHKILPAIYIVVSKCAYALGREKVGKLFYDFVKKNVLAIESKEHLKFCVQLMEAVLGYYRMYNTREN